MSSAAGNLLRHLAAMAALAVLIGGLNRLADIRTPPPWSEAEIELLASLSLDALPPPPADPSNAVADAPLAAELGERLFFDPRLSANGRVSCATCHQPERRFTDGLAKGRGIGEAGRNTQSIVAAAHSPWAYWNGRRDSLWAQALTPLEDPAEHGFNRLALVRVVANDAGYRNDYERLFGALPDLTDSDRYPAAASPLGDDAELQAAWNDMSAGDRQRINTIFANLGKALAAFERGIQPRPSRFDDYVAALRDGDTTAAARLFDQQEVRGLRLFIGRGQCIQCHNGPLLTNNEFHNTGVIPAPGEVPDIGRAEGLRLARADPFNCLGNYNDAAEPRCAELRFARSGADLIGAMRTPSLRNLESTQPYMHKGQLADLAAVLEHYNRAPEAMIGHNEAKPLGLKPRDLAELEAFLRTLDAPVAGVD
ncbi:MAG: cytochrome c peroxidase [Gammaproteobacteria bacterium]|nr:cytochrome c peroxidase [Gammaproteobacteria bacterium]